VRDEGGRWEGDELRVGVPRRSLKISFFLDYRELSFLTVVVDFGSRITAENLYYLAH